MKQPLRPRARFLSVRAVTRLTGVPPQRLRRYEEEGLILSEQVIHADGERLYETSVLSRVRRIRSYEAVGVNLAGIEVILRLLEQRARGRR